MNYETSNTDTSSPLLSIIIPTYNRVQLIKYTLDSLGKEYHPGVDFEIIVVDDGSNDGTQAMIRQHYPAVRLFSNEKKGAAAARNKGLVEAQGKYVQFLDSDDLVGENFFLKKLEFLEANSLYHAAYGGYDYFVSNTDFTQNQVVFKYKYPMLAGHRNGKEHLVNYLAGNYTPLNSIIWQKRFIAKIKGLDESLSINQDVELFVRAIFKGLLINAVDDGTRVYVRSHDVDERVGDPNNEKNKHRQILELRKKIHADLRIYAYDETECYAALSSYLFDHWKKLRHTSPGLANAYLDFAKSVYWPVRVKGNVGIRLLAVMLGPVRAVNVKHFLLKRD